MCKISKCIQRFKIKHYVLAFNCYCILQLFFSFQWATLGDTPCMLRVPTPLTSNFLWDEFTLRDYHLRYDKFSNYNFEDNSIPDHKFSSDMKLLYFYPLYQNNRDLKFSSAKVCFNKLASIL